MKTKLLLITAILLMITSCKADKDEYYMDSCRVCNCEQIEKLQSFISDKVIKASNNMSDEEMEDVISQLERTGIQIYCPKKAIPHIRKAGDRFGEVDYTKIDSCQFVMY